MTKIKDPKIWLIAALLLLMLAWMTVIIKNHHDQNVLQEKIYNHSEIADTV